jgi:hypothetical protein
VKTRVQLAAAFVLLPALLIIFVLLVFFVASRST